MGSLKESEASHASEVDFVPSQVNLNRMFIGTFEHMEAENTAAVMVAALAMNGDTWRVVTCEELSDGFGQLTRAESPGVSEGLMRGWFNNPFAHISIQDLVTRGFAEWEGDRAVRFTSAGLERMRKWVVK